MQKIIKSNFFTVNNASNILTQDLNKKIAYNRVNKLNIIPNKYISLSLSLKPKLNKVWCYIYYLLYFQSSLFNCYISYKDRALEYINIKNVMVILIILSKKTMTITRILLNAFYYIFIITSN